MNEKTEKTDRVSVRVSFLCKLCGKLFKCVSTYYTHKVRHHFQHNRSIVFEESIVDLNDNEPNFATVVADEPQIIQLEGRVQVEVKQEPPDPIVFISEGVISSTKSITTNPLNLLALTYDDGEPKTNSEIKTEWVEEIVTKCDSYQRQNSAHVCHTNSVNKQQGNEEYINNNLYDNTDETQSSFLGSDVDSSHGQGHVNELGHYPRKDSYMTRSTGSVSTSTSTLLTETEHHYFKEISSDSDSSEDDIICLDDLPPPRSNKVAIGLIEPTTSTTTSILNNLAQQRLQNLQCQICSKQFVSEALLGIHVGICQLYNSAQMKTITSTQSPTPPPAVSAVAVENKRTKRRKQGMVPCDVCLKVVKRCHLRTHLETKHKIFGKDSSRNFVCHICGSAFESKSGLIIHLKVHSDDKPWKCSFPNCPFAFKHKQGVEKHIKTYHTTPI